MRRGLGRDANWTRPRAAATGGCDAGAAATIVLMAGGGSCVCGCGLTRLTGPEFGVLGEVNETGPPLFVLLAAKDERGGVDGGAACRDGVA